MWQNREWLLIQIKPELYFADAERKVETWNKTADTTVTTLRQEFLQSVRAPLVIVVSESERLAHGSADQRLSVQRHFSEEV